MVMFAIEQGIIYATIEDDTNLYSCKTETFKNYYPSTTKFWNNLDESIRSIKSKSCLKEKLKHQNIFSLPVLFIKMLNTICRVAHRHTGWFKSTHYFTRNPIENENIVQLLILSKPVVNVFLLSQSKLLRLSISSVLRSIHMQLEMESTSVAAAEPPQQQHYIVL